MEEETWDHFINCEAYYEHLKTNLFNRILPEPRTKFNDLWTNLSSETSRSCIRGEWATDKMEQGQSKDLANLIISLLEERW